MKVDSVKGKGSPAGRARGGVSVAGQEGAFRVRREVADREPQNRSPGGEEAERPH